MSGLLLPYHLCHTKVSKKTTRSEKRERERGGQEIMKKKKSERSHSFRRGRAGQSNSTEGKGNTSPVTRKGMIDVSNQSTHTRKTHDTRGGRLHPWWLPSIRDSEIHARGGATRGTKTEMIRGKKDCSMNNSPGDDLRRALHRLDVVLSCGEGADGSELGVLEHLAWHIDVSPPDVVLLELLRQLRSRVLPYLLLNPKVPDFKHELELLEQCGFTAIACTATQKPTTHFGESAPEVKGLEGVFQVTRHIHTEELYPIPVACYMAMTGGDGVHPPEHIRGEEAHALLDGVERQKCHTLVVREHTTPKVAHIHDLPLAGTSVMEDPGTHRGR
eukprot:Hpha_TRINITY_DN15887_c0_g1::TRINITY_DN15887_c0_g1_i1::g.189679::m.189679